MTFIYNEGFKVKFNYNKRSIADISGDEVRVYCKRTMLTHRCAVFLAHLLFRIVHSFNIESSSRPNYSSLFHYSLHDCGSKTSLALYCSVSSVSWRSLLLWNCTYSISWVCPTSILKWTFLCRMWIYRKMYDF